ncbi:coiled-coil domain-containing protein [Ohtaekwangia koreensis]|uniref:Signal transduction histidine kinase dimerisation/phosphoacceptor domain-containing protein n=1 Tax=Ohtaekwangia koreensis TaxID=688867 RepID=A0A1T5J609_9BACT|nr:hypothetical protein [Ohtaekwangia koreensis]SKC46673.1 hypothetical protein SAMN05660236_0775 [Ohtaekwangia koreensis]
MLDFLIKTNTPEGRAEASRVIAFRYYLLAVILFFVFSICFELIFDFRSISLPYLVVLAVAPALLLALSIKKVSHKLLVVINVLFLLLVNQAQILSDPTFFHTWVFWIGLIPLLLTMFTRSFETMSLTFIVIAFMVANGIYVNTHIGSYDVTISPAQFTAGGVLFTLITATVAILFSYTQHAINKRLVNQNLTLQLMTVEIEEQNKMLKDQNEEITSINNRLEEANFLLEERVAKRTQELENHNQRLAEYAFINSHLLRGPLCSILGLINLLNKTSLSENEKEILRHLKESSHNLDDVVSKISKALTDGPELDRELIRKLKD